MTETTGDDDDPRIYMQIAADVRGKLATGVIAEGDTVSITRLSGEWGTSRPTVSRALRTLEADGLLRRYPGYGYYVLPR
jgi:DNA-binding GntR family transcriptional regulator